MSNNIQVFYTQKKPIIVTQEIDTAEIFKMRKWIVVKNRSIYYYCCTIF